MSTPARAAAGSPAAIPAPAAANGAVLEAKGLTIVFGGSFVVRGGPSASPLAARSEFARLTPFTPIPCRARVSGRLS